LPQSDFSQNTLGPRLELDNAVGLFVPYKKIAPELENSGAGKGDNKGFS
jgi:hypothetical protein